MMGWPMLAMALAAGVHGVPNTSVTPVGHYTVRKGDTLISLERKGLVGRDAVVTIMRVNHIKSPRFLPIGQVLEIPRNVLRDEGSYASVESFSGPVTLSVGGQTLATRAGVAIGEGARIRTGRNGFVTLRLRDDTAITLPSQTDFTIARLRRILLTGAVERQFVLGNGRAHSTVTPMPAPDSEFRVVTPVSVAAVRGTDFQVEFADATQSAVTAVGEGRVAVAAQATGTADARKSDLVTAGLGLAIAQGKMGAPTPLLAAPGLEDPGKVQTGENLAFRLAPVPGASAYRAQIARDAGALDVIAETQVADPALVFDPIVAGSWFLRVSAVDGQGIEGKAETYAFDRYRNEVAGSLAQSSVGRHHVYLFKWNGAADGKVRYRFRLWRDGLSNQPIVDEIGQNSKELSVTDLPPGDYNWQISSTIIAGNRVIETLSPERKLKIAKPR